MDDVRIKLGRDRIAAHQVLFAHRHPDATPKFHERLIALWHEPKIPKALVMAFREAGKSTIAEEAFVVGACYQLWHNAVIIGSTEKRACERLRAIKYELDTNELIRGLFGDLGERTARVWNEAEVILANGVRIIAVGRGQSLRGTKHLHYRPDFAFCDDIEDREHVTTPDARAATQAWFMDELIPALDRNARIRMNATPLDKDSLPMRIQKWEAWSSLIFPVETLDADGNRQPTWPARYSLDWINNKKKEYEDAGDLEGYAREYMCVAEDPRTKIFKSDMFLVRSRVRTWEPVFAFYDPARTTNRTSATTGFAVWSYVGASRLIVWDSGGELWQPDQLIDHIFKIADEYQPVAIGVEQTGLNEFLLQPLRAEQMRRNTILPLKAIDAPRGKLDFIGALQPYFSRGEITFARDQPELVRQFLNFPTGRIDAPNALAYALRMRPGVVVYEDFSQGHVADHLAVRARAPVWCCLNAGTGVTTAVVVQLIDGVIHVLGDDVKEGDPGATLGSIVKAAQVEFGPVRLVAGDKHYLGRDHLGLRGAVAKLPAELRHGGADEVGREEIRRLLRTQARGAAAFRVAVRARWTLNALACGYARSVDKRGQISDEPAPGIYATLVQGLESFTALLRLDMLSDDSRPNWRVTEGGQRYVSALPNRQPVLPSKDDWAREPDLGTGLSALPDRAR
jgi:hypothetical protein